MDRRKIALITGASSGIGKATAEKLAASGMNLILWGRRVERLIELKNSLEETFNVEVKVQVVDITRSEEVQQAASLLKSVDVLINNAGMMRGRTSILEGDPENWDLTIQTNLNGLLYVTKYIAPKLIESDQAFLINIASIGSKEVYPNGNVYCATKYGVEAITKSLRRELLPHGVRVAQVCPGGVRTEFAVVAAGGNEEKGLQHYEGHTPLEAIDVAETIDFILSRPDHVNINDTIVMPTVDAWPYYGLNKEVSKDQPEINTVLITGATSGIGEACAWEFAPICKKIILTGRREENLSRLKIELQEKFELEVETLCFDVRNRVEVQAALKEIEAVDVLINNAGLAVGKSTIDEGLYEDWDRMIDTNVKGLLNVSKEMLPKMTKKKKGHVVNIGSVAGKEVYAGGNVYCATKHAVDALSKAMRIDLLDKGIRVTNIAPGAVNTEFSLVRFKGDMSTVDRVYDGYRPLLAKDIAECIYFACQRPQHVNINDMLIMPKAQASSAVLIKEE